LVGPTLSVYPPAAGENLDELCRFTATWDLNGWPAASVPVGIGEHGLPVGLHIVGKPWSEALVLRAARAVEVAHALSFPPVAVMGDG
jgi:aspartyl-tRNA(Asn)/glutamyl-tRNA(Gln) amidotransferase subunit A